jgi:hypothetical protein
MLSTSDVPAVGAAMTSPLVDTGVIADLSVFMVVIDMWDFICGV